MNAEEFACYVAFLFDDAWSDYCMNMPKSIVIGTLIVHVIVEHVVTCFCSEAVLIYRVKTRFCCC